MTERNVATRDKDMPAKIEFLPFETYKFLQQTAGRTNDETALLFKRSIDVKKSWIMWKVFFWELWME